MCPPGRNCWYRSTDQNLRSSHLCPLGLWGVEAGVSTGPRGRPPGAFEKLGGVGVAGVSCGPGRCSGQTAWSLVRWLGGLSPTRDPVGSHQTHGSWTRGNRRVCVAPAAELAARVGAGGQGRAWPEVGCSGSVPGCPGERVSGRTLHVHAPLLPGHGTLAGPGLWPRCDGRVVFEVPWKRPGGFSASEESCGRDVTYQQHRR